VTLSAGKETLLAQFWGKGSFSCQHYSADISAQSGIVAKTSPDARIMWPLLKVPTCTSPLPKIPAAG
jgi:hypothetical protein